MLPLLLSMLLIHRKSLIDAYPTEMGASFVAYTLYTQQMCSCVGIEEHLLLG